MKHGKRNLAGGVLLGIAVLLVGGFFWWRQKPQPSGNTSTPVEHGSQDTSGLLSTVKLPTYVPPGKKILYVDSYHVGYPWSDGILEGVKSVLKGLDVELKTIHMDTKRNLDEAFMKQAGQRVKEFIEKYQPDVVIAADDNAQKYVVARFYKNAKLPFVFCGVNWDASIYGYPFENVTGMVEVEPVEALVGHLRPYAKGNRVGVMGADVVTDRKVAHEYNERFFKGRAKVYCAGTLQEFETLFRKAQIEVDMLIIHNQVGIKHWDDDKAVAFIRDTIRIPTGSMHSHAEHLVIFTIAKMAEEQGQWAAQTALWILSGKPPTDIPIQRNEEFSLVINLKMADALGITIPVSTLRAASEIIRDDGEKLLKPSSTEASTP